MSEQITTPEQLDALPVGTVLLGSDGHVWQPRPLHRRYPWQSLTGGAYSRESDFLADAAPLTVIYRPDAAPVEPHTLPTEAEVAQVIRDAVLNYDPSEGDEVPSMAARAILAMFDSRYTYGVWTRHDGQKVPYREDALALDPDEALRFHTFPAECGCYPLNTDNREWACEHGATWTRGSMEPYGKPTTGPIYPYGGDR